MTSPQPSACAAGDADRVLAARAASWTARTASGASRRIIRRDSRMAKR